MAIYTRVARGAEAGALAAASTAAAFFVLDLVQLDPLATPATLAGAGLTPAGFALDLTSVSSWMGALWAFSQITLLTLAHVGTLALAGIVASIAFDWTRFGGLGRILMLVALCAGAFYATVSLVGIVLAPGSVGAPVVVGMSVLSAVMLAVLLRVLALPEPEERQLPTGSMV